jgi:hypothetical protein
LLHEVGDHALGQGEARRAVVVEVGVERAHAARRVQGDQQIDPLAPGRILGHETHGTRQRRRDQEQRCAAQGERQQPGGLERGALQRAEPAPANGLTRMRDADAPRASREGEEPDHGDRGQPGGEEAGPL